MRRSSRAEEIRLAQYELPGTAAGLVRANIVEVRRLLRAQRERYGGTVLLEHATEHLELALQRIEEWIVASQALTDYEYATQVIKKKG
jgi:hypothetical protein